MFEESVNPSTSTATDRKNRRPITVSTRVLNRRNPSLLDPHLCFRGSNPSTSTIIDPKNPTHQIAPPPLCTNPKNQIPISLSNNPRRRGGSRSTRGGGREEVDQYEEEEEEEEEVDQYEEQSMDEIYGKLQCDRVSRTNSDTKPASGEMPAKLPRKMKKSASAKSAFAHFEEDEIVEARRPETMREGKVSVTEDDDEVDAKADDFINKFKQQLKLQRLDSMMDYKGGINRGSVK
ncbi:hypothetical protein SLA2020_274160 [Shorea laevis]